MWRILPARPLRLWQLVSHKLMRWLVAPVLMILLLSTLGLLRDSPPVAYTIIALGQLGFYAAALAGGTLHRLGKHPGVLYVPYHFLALHAAALVGVVQGLVKGAPSIWEKPASARDHKPCDNP